MYSRQGDGRGEIALPPNYSGNAFRQRRANVHLTPERRPQSPSYGKDRREAREREQLPSQPQQRFDEAQGIPLEETQINEKAAKESEEKTAEVSALPQSLLSPLGSLGTEEILLLALALIIFQSGKDPELALILLALLFVN